MKKMFISIIDVLRRAGLEVVVAGVDKRTILGANGIEIITDIEISDVSSTNLDMIVLPGGWGGTDILAINERVQSILKEMNGRGKPIGAICAAPYALEVAGVLNQNFTCYPSVEDRIGQTGYSDKSMVVKDRNILTSRGPGTAICFALHIVKELLGQHSYQELKDGLLADYCE